MHEITKPVFFFLFFFLKNMKNIINLSSAEVVWRLLKIYYLQCLKFKHPGCSFSKLMMSLVNILLKLLSLNVAYMLKFLLNQCE